MVHTTSGPYVRSPSRDAFCTETSWMGSERKINVSLNNWITYANHTSDISLQVVEHEETNRSVLSFQGYHGEVYLLPKQEYNIRGHLSGCFRILYTKKVFAPLSEVRIYCMMSQEDLREKGSCYMASLNGDCQVHLRKYTQGLSREGTTLACLHLPAEYKRGVFGLLWMHNPLIRKGVFFRGMLSVNPSKPEDAFCLFDCVDIESPLLVSGGEGFGLSILEEGFTEVLIGRTALHKLEYIETT